MPLSFQKVELPDFNDTVGKEFLEACGRGDLVTVQESPKLSDGVWRSNGLEDAANGDQPVMMEFLLEKGAIIQTWTVDAARSQGAWEALLKYGLDVNNPMPQARVPLM